VWVIKRLFLTVLFSSLIVSCSSTIETSLESTTQNYNSEYLIGPGDTLNVFVWRNPEISITVPVRPDGYISTPLVEDMLAVDKTPTALARNIEKRLSRYIRKPVVTVLVTGFVGTYGNQIRVIGEAANPQAFPYREDMTILDVMIAAGGLTDFAAGNRAKIIRRYEGKNKQFTVRLEDLIKDGDISANVKVVPGDIILIPESIF